MKRKRLAFTLVTILSLVLLASPGWAQTMDQGTMGKGGSQGSQQGMYGQYCPCMMMNPNMMGRGMMGGQGWGSGMMMNPNMMGRGMMGGQGWGSGMMMNPNMMGRGMMGGQGWGSGMMMNPSMMGRGWGYGQRYGQPPKPLKEEDVRTNLENYIRATRNPNLKLGKITEKENIFEAEIVTKEGSLVDKLMVNKFTGMMRSIY